MKHELTFHNGFMAEAIFFLVVECLIIVGYILLLSNFHYYSELKINMVSYLGQVIFGLGSLFRGGGGSHLSQKMARRQIFALLLDSEDFCFISYWEIELKHLLVRWKSSCNWQQLEPPCGLHTYKSLLGLAGSACNRSDHFVPHPG